MVDALVQQVEELMGGQENKDNICRLQKLGFKISYIRLLKEKETCGVLFMDGNGAHFRLGISNQVVWERFKEQERIHLLERKSQKDKGFLFVLFTTASHTKQLGKRFAGWMNELNKCTKGRRE